MPKSALEGELGRWVAPNGFISTEISITIEDKRLNSGRPTNIPTLVEGQINPGAIVFSTGADITPEQVEQATLRAIERVKEGQTLPSFDTMEQAVEAAIDRSNSKK